MTKITCVILGLLLAAMGVIELVGVNTNLTYIYFAVIALGIIGVLIGVYARQGGKTDARLHAENASLKKDIEHLKMQLADSKKATAKEADRD